MAIDGHALKREFFQIIKTRPNAEKVLYQLSNDGDLLLFGGGVRQFFEDGYQTMPRDFDIVVNTSTLDLSPYFNDQCFTKNRYGGFKLILDDLTFDIWNITSTWAFSEKKVVYKIPADLTKTVFFNFDSIVCNLQSGEIYEGGYFKAYNDKILDIVLYDNPFPELNVLRALAFKKEHNFQFSPELFQYMSKWILNNFKNNLYIKLLLNIQKKHYGFEKITENELRQATDSIISCCY